LLIFLLAAVLLFGFAASAPSPTFRPTDRLEVMRFFLIDPALNHMASEAWTVHDTEAAGQLERALLALPPSPNGFRWGAIDDGAGI
jgi:hypothetical protein